MLDLAWCNGGGTLIDSTGDIAFSTSDWSCLVDMVNTRLKTTLKGWKLYSIGANLQSLIGSSQNADTESQIQKLVQMELTNNFLPLGSFTVSTIPVGKLIKVYVFIQNTLVASSSVTL